MEPLYFLLITRLLGNAFMVALIYFFFRWYYYHPPKGGWLLDSWKSNEKALQFIATQYWIPILAFILLSLQSVWFALKNFG